MNRRKFIGACTFCAFAGAGTILLNKSNILKEKEDKPDYDSSVRRLGVHLAEHCNLKCKYCGHFSCIAEKEFYDLDKFRQDMDRMSYVYKKHLLELQLLGGEPLLNPNINEYVKHSRLCFPDADIKIITNAILLDSMDESFWKTLNENNIFVTPTVYPIEINWKSIFEKAEKYNVKFYGDSMYKKELNVDNIYKFRRNFFSKMALNEKGNNGFDNSKCTRRLVSNCMNDGKFYPCTSMAYVRHLNKKFGTNFKVTKYDYVDLYKIDNVKEIKKFIKASQFPFCNYCCEGTWGVKWENAAEHDVSEWT